MMGVHLNYIKGCWHEASLWLSPGIFLHCRKWLIFKCKADENIQIRRILICLGELSSPFSGGSSMLSYIKMYVVSPPLCLGVYCKGREAPFCCAPSQYFFRYFLQQKFCDSKNIY